jgi:hypothetical protein
MATTTAPAATSTASATAASPATVERRVRTLVPEQRVVLRGIDWDGYETILKLVGDQPAARLTYDRGDLELMAPSLDHEESGSLLGRMVETVTEEIIHWLQQAESIEDHSEWGRRFREWVRAELAPRLEERR